MGTLQDDYKTYTKEIEDIASVWNNVAENKRKKISVTNCVCNFALVLLALLVVLIITSEQTGIDVLYNGGLVRLMAALIPPALSFYFVMATQRDTYTNAEEIGRTLHDLAKVVKVKTDILAAVLWESDQPFATASTSSRIFKYTREDITDIDNGENVARITLTPADGEKTPLLCSVYGLTACEKITNTLPLTTKNRAMLNKMQNTVKKRCADLRLFSNYSYIFPAMHYCVTNCSSEQDAAALAEAFHNICMHVAYAICEQKLRDFLTDWNKLNKTILSQSSTYDESWEIIVRSLDIHTDTKDILQYFTKNGSNGDVFSETLARAEQYVNISEVPQKMISGTSS